MALEVRKLARCWNVPFSGIKQEKITMAAKFSVLWPDRMRTFE
jgi:hypothetical protein